jgi:Tol biopolymer transport system component
MEDTVKRMIFAIVLVVLVGAGPSAQSGYELLQQALSKEQAEGKVAEAIVIYQRIAKEFASDRALAAKALLRLGEAYQKLGDRQAQQAFERIVRDYSDQKEAAGNARARLAALQSPPASRTAPAARQIWAGEGVSGEGGPSPDGRYLTFTDWSTGDLAMRDLVTGVNRRLTNTGGWVASGDFAQNSVISPDGKSVAYAWFIEKARKRELRTVSIATRETAPSKVVLRTETEDLVAPFAWTLDGRQLFVIRSLSNNMNQIGAISIQDGTFRAIKSLEWRRPERLSLSPDGRYIAYDVPAGDRTSPRDIYVLAADGSSDMAVVQGPANDRSPVWAPDGSQLLFLSDRTGSNALWAAPIGSGRAQGPASSIRTDVGQMALLGMTKSGTLHYFMSGRARRNLYGADFDGMRATKTPVLATEQFINANIGPAWSRDGQYLAYYSFRNPAVLAIRSTKTDDERIVPLPKTLATPFNSGPKWFPDNRSVLILLRDPQGSEGSGHGFYRLAIDTGATELLARLPRQVSSFDLSADGRSIFYVFQNPNTGQLMRFDVESRREVELKKNEWFISAAVSPDGTQLAYLKSIRGSGAPSGTFPSVIEVMPAAGGESREVFRAPTWLGGARYNTLAWTPDQRFLLFVQDDHALWKVPAVGGEASKVGISMTARIKSPAVHPDGKRIVFSAIDADKSEVWVLENFLARPNGTK